MQDHVSEGDRSDLTRDDGLDLLTAALLGALVGAGTALMFTRSRRPQPWSARMAKAARRGAHRASGFGKRGRRGMGAMAGNVWGQLSDSDASKQVSSYFDSVREAIDDTVSAELQDLRKSLRRQRKKLGI